MSEYTGGVIDSFTKVVVCKDYLDGTSQVLFRGLAQDVHQFIEENMSVYCDDIMNGQLFVMTLENFTKDATNVTYN